MRSTSTSNVAATAIGPRRSAICIRSALQKEAWDRGADIVVTISMIYDHHVRDLADALIEIQHDHTERIIATTHVHLDHQHCLEVILAKGPSNELKRLADKLIGTKGVIAGDVSGLAIVGAREPKKTRAVGKATPPSKKAKASRPEKKRHGHSHPHD